MKHIKKIIALLFIAIAVCFIVTCNAKSPQEILAENIVDYIATKQSQEVVAVEDIVDSIDTKLSQDVIIRKNADSIHVDSEPDTLLLPVVYDEEVEIQITGIFRIDNPSLNHFDYLFEDGWNELCQDHTTSKFHLIKASPKVEIYYDDCIQDSSLSLNSYNYAPVLFVKGVGNSQLDVKSVRLHFEAVLSGTEMVFEFNNQEYFLVAGGYLQDKTYPS